VEERTSFLKKRSKKLFVNFPPGDVAASRVKVLKVFCGAFFQKSDLFLKSSSKNLLTQPMQTAYAARSKKFRLPNPISNPHTSPTSPGASVLCCQPFGPSDGKRSSHASRPILSYLDAILAGMRR
jgi:hypothetical protein